MVVVPIAVLCNTQLPQVVAQVCELMGMVSAGPAGRLARSQVLVVIRQHQQFTVPTRCSLCLRQVNAFCTPLCPVYLAMCISALLPFHAAM